MALDLRVSTEKGAVAHLRCCAKTARDLKECVPRESCMAPGLRHGRVPVLLSCPPNRGISVDRFAHGDSPSGHRRPHIGSARAVAPAQAVGGIATGAAPGSVQRIAGSCVRVVVEHWCAVHSSALIDGLWMSLRKPCGWQREWPAKRMSPSDGRGCVTSTRARSAGAATGKIPSFPSSWVCTNALQFTWERLDSRGCSMRVSSAAARLQRRCGDARHAPAPAGAPAMAWLLSGTGTADAFASRPRCFWSFFLAR